MSFPFPGDHSDSGIEPTSPALVGRFFTTSAKHMEVKDMDNGEPVWGDCGEKHGEQVWGCYTCLGGNLLHW